jgi:beta-RFAP synthase
MIDQPCTKIRIRRAARFAVSGSPRVATFFGQWIKHLGIKRPDFQIDQLQAPPEHSGLGSGTQLAQAIAAGVNRLLDLSDPDPVHVARVLDRGQRSLIGSLGFACGGLVADSVQIASADSRERVPANVAGALAAQATLPPDWRVVLAHHQNTARTFGETEKAAFAKLMMKKCNTGQRLGALIREAILPAARTGDFEQFSDAVFDYGRTSGLYYLPIQGGAYNGPALTEIVDKIRALDVRGVGQSSWGPVVFAWCRDTQQADWVKREMKSRFGTQVDISVSGVCNHPATVVPA